VTSPAKLPVTTNSLLARAAANGRAAKRANYPSADGIAPPGSAEASRALSHPDYAHAEVSFPKRPNSPEESGYGHAGGIVSSVLTGRAARAREQAGYASAKGIAQSVSSPKGNAPAAVGSGQAEGITPSLSSPRQLQENRRAQADYGVVPNAVSRSDSASTTKN
jgi:hypothetical protein